MTGPASDDFGREKSSAANDQEPMHPRAARIKRGEAYDYVAHLEFARRLKLRLGGTSDALDEEVRWVQREINRLSQWCDQRIEPRRRWPKAVPSVGQERAEYHLFLDECGSHNLNPIGDQFPVFCLCGVIVAAAKYHAFDTRWKSWKAHHLGSADVLVHEPKVRTRSHYFYRADQREQQDLLDSLGGILDELEFTCISAVVDKRRFTDLYAAGKVDDFLPSSAYLMCVDFIFERFVHFLYFAANDARGLAQAESRGPREDAEVHAEFLRLHLQGTRWQPESQFRHALRPYMEFRRKSRNVSGLQIADLVARPIAEKVLNPAGTPRRWNVVEPKIYDGGKGRKSSYGLKIFPRIDPQLMFAAEGDY